MSQIATNKEQQDLAWACLPKEVRNKIRKEYDISKVSAQAYTTPSWQTLEWLYGKHNLTSDTELEEMLMVSVKKAVERIRYLKRFPKEYSVNEANAIAAELLSFFGDKCLPDKEVNEDNFAKSELEHRLEQTVQASVQAEPKYKVGDRIKTDNESYSGEIGTIIDYAPNVIYEVELDDSTQDWFDECDLEPYTEPETKPLRVGDKVRVKGEDKVREVYRILPDGYIMFGDKGNRYSVEELELVEPETKDNMEEKDKIKELFTKENLDEIVSSMLKYTAIITQDVINEASKYKPEEERIFIKGAAWMLYHLVKNRGQRHVYIEKDMDLDEAIQHCTAVLPLAETAQCAREHVQLRDWLTELKQYRENKQ